MFLEYKSVKFQVPRAPMVFDDIIARSLSKPTFARRDATAICLWSSCPKPEDWRVASAVAV